MTLRPDWQDRFLREVCEHVPNCDPTRSPENEFEYVDIGAVDNVTGRIGVTKKFLGRDAPSRARRPIQPGDVLFSNVRTYLKNIARVTDAVSANLCSTGFTVLRPGSELDSRYLYHYVRSDAFVAAVTPEQTGTHYPATSDRVVLGQSITLPPTIEDQRRIANKLDHIVVHLDDTRARLETIPAILRRFRMSVLAAACSGRLTANWRRGHPPVPVADNVIETIKLRRLEEARIARQLAAIEECFACVEEGDSELLPVAWRFVSLDKLATFDYGTSAKSQKTGLVPVLRMGNVQEGEIDWGDLVFTSEAAEIAKYSLQPDTVLFNRTNSPEWVGKTAIYRGERPAIFAGYLIRINAEAELLPEYLNYCLNSPSARAWCAQVKTDGVSQSNINAQKLGKFEIPLCSIEEQAEIVRRTDAMFKQADAIEARYDKAKTFTDKVMPAVLAKAFRGELIEYGEEGEQHG